MEAKAGKAVLCLLVLFGFWTSAGALLSPKGVNFEVQALMSIKASLVDPHNVLENWDHYSVDPCSWTMVTCSPENLVIGLGTPSQNLSGTLSPSIGNLTNIQIVLLQNNNISGPIPSEIGKLTKLRTLDLSNNFFTGEIPSSLSHLKSLEYLRLNNNSLSGAFPLYLANMTQLGFLDLSYNNLSGPIPRFPARTFNIVGNPMICPTRSEQDCYGTEPMPLSFNLNNSQSSQPSGRPRSHKVAFALGTSLGGICLLIFGFGLLLWWRQRHNQQIFFDVNDQHHEEVCLGNLKRFNFRELQIATDNFSSKNIVGKGGFGVVYKASRLKEKPALDWGTRKRIALGAARGLLYLHEQCDPKIIHRDSSEKTDVFGFGILLLELITGQTALEFGKAANQKGVMLDWVKNIHQEKKLDMLVDKDLKSNYDRLELEEMVQVALLCTQFLPGQRPKMSEVVRMLEGDGLAERWEASQRAEANKCRPHEFSSSERYSDLTDDSSLLVQAMELSGPR
ncbi:hypothetical protein MRB53_023390 [Persea americana]|uniref:Uncharacterized protein n=1 Tax=Persea americana TaxID=3435 RepID=A0ACC2L9N3_PERAE|nr:hypothetical protein MRB53_023390 [Persea americana]